MVRNGYGGQGCAILEATIVNDLHRVGNRDGSQAFTFIEGMVRQFLDGARKRDGGQTDAKTVFATSYFSIVCE